MQASNKLLLKTLLSPLAIALVLITPCAFAKKDLFANDPGAKQAYPTEQLVNGASSSSSSSKASSREEALAETVKNEEQAKSPVAQAKSTTDAEPEKKDSYLETQLSRLKRHLIEAKDDLFGSKKSDKKETPSVPQQTETTLADNTHSSEESHSSEEAHIEVPTISAAEAAQRAQTLAEGQVINVRKYVEEDKPRYAVKMLQKNGRMKTINLDAVNGTLIEETPE